MCTDNDPGPCSCQLLVDVLIITACSGGVNFLFVQSRITTAPSRKESNDFTGAVVAVIGTTYAVILAFMLSGRVEHVPAGAANEEQEANSLTNIWRIAGKSRTPAKQNQALCLKYAHDAVDKEWPAMAAAKPFHRRLRKRSTCCGGSQVKPRKIPAAIPLRCIK